MRAQKGAKLKTWGLMLGALKAAKEEGKAMSAAGQLFGLPLPAKAAAKRT